MVGARSIWQGTLRVNGLAQIPVKAYAATNAAGKLSFNELHKECGSRIQHKKWCSRCGRAVAREDIESGYHYSDGHFVRVTEEEKAQSKAGAPMAIDVKRVCAADEFDPMYVHNTYYLAPLDRRAASAYLTMARAFRGWVGIGTVSMVRRDYLVALRAVGDTLVMYTLHRDAELHKPGDIEIDLSAAKAIDADVKRVSTALTTLQGRFDLAEFKDRYTEALWKVIEAKVGCVEAARTTAEAEKTAA